MTTTTQASLTETGIRYKQPRIITIDLPQSTAQRLRSAGYNVQSGTFGRPYKVKKGDGYVPVVVEARP